MSLKTIDVAIGIIFLYLLLTFLASAIVEVISRILNWRARNLHDAIKTMLSGNTWRRGGRVTQNPLVVALGREAWTIPRLVFRERSGGRKPTDRTPPAYTPAGTFSGVVLEHLMGLGQASSLSPEGAIASVRKSVESAEQGGDALLSLPKTTLPTQGESIQAGRLPTQNSFTQPMTPPPGC